MMKAKEAHKSLEVYAGDDLYLPACRLYQTEVSDTIELRSHGKNPTVGVVEGAIKQTNDWFKKVAEGLSWEDSELPGNIIKWEASRVWVKYGIEDPEITRYRHRARYESMRGTPLPLLKAMGPDTLDAVGGMMLANIQKDLRKLDELHDKRGKFADTYGVRLCVFGPKERFCEHQKTYSIVEGLPTSTEDLAFICTVDECIKDKEAG